MAQVILQWPETHVVEIFTRFIPGRHNIILCHLGCYYQIIPTKWSLLPRVLRKSTRSLEDLWWIFLSCRLPGYIFASRDMAWKEDALYHPCAHQEVYVFPSFALSRCCQLDASADWPYNDFCGPSVSLLVEEPLRLQYSGISLFSLTFWNFFKNWMQSSLMPFNILDNMFEKQTFH